jgi:hypothetical protein
MSMCTIPTIDLGRFREVGENYLKGCLRSHPDVAQRYFADLVRPEASAQASSGC